MRTEPRVNKDGGVSARRRKTQEDVRVRGRLSQLLGGRGRREGGAGVTDRWKSRRGCAPGGGKRKGRGQPVASGGVELLGPAGARGSVALADALAAAATAWSPSVCGRRVMAAAAVGAVNEFSRWTREEERLRRPQQSGASEASALLPGSRPSRRRAGPSAAVAA